MPRDYYISADVGNASKAGFHRVVDPARLKAPTWKGAPLSSMEYIIALWPTREDAEATRDALNGNKGN